MKTVVLGERPSKLEELIRERAAIGADRWDEVWGGDYHMAPPPNGAHGWLEDQFAMVLRDVASSRGLHSYPALNIGESTDYRVPDRVILREAASRTWYPTAALVLEVVSPGDESWQKFGFYAAHGVDEVVIADPRDHSLRWFVRNGADYEPVEHSTLLDIAVADVYSRLTWPPPLVD